MKKLGIAFLLAAILVVAGLWLIPFSPSNSHYRVQHCIAIRDARKDDIPGFVPFAGGCREGATKRMEASAFAGSGLALVGVLALISVAARNPRWD